MTIPQKIGKYDIVGELGRGGMGVVYRAIDPVIQRPVALKTVIKSLLDPVEAQGLLDRFKREAQAAGRLLHQNIVSVYDYGEDGEYAYIAMEFVDGRGLNEYLTPGAPVAAERVRPLVAQILDALSFAHSNGVVHRDIKPSNLMMRSDWRVKVSDFGIAQIDSSKLTQMGTVLGTPSYMSPEQFQGQVVDATTDIFSAGVVIYELLTGRKPFVGDSIGALIHAVLHTPPRPPSEVNPDLNSAFDSLLIKALAVKSSDRFNNAKDFAKALDAAFDGEIWDDIAAAEPTALLPPVASLPGRAATTPGAIRKIDFNAVTRKINTAATSNAIAQTSPQAVRPSVLFVDDEERILSALNMLFKQQYDVHITTDAAQALLWLKARRFHVLVSDQRMPNMNGTELLSKAKVISPNTVRILLTGYSDLAAIIGSINEGEVYRFANKPWNTAEIRALLADAVAIGLELEDAPAAVASDGTSSDAVLIVDDDRETYLAASNLFGAQYRLVHAPDLPKALDLMRDESIAVVVADIGGSHHDNRTLFKMLKREHPQILTIAVTDASDSDLVIELINQAQIFRFLSKPLKLTTLKLHIAAAMTQFQKFKAQPKLLLQQKVDQPVGAEKVAAEESSVGRLILGSLRALRARLTGG